MSPAPIIATTSADVALTSFIRSTFPITFLFDSVLYNDIFENPIE